VTRSDTETLIRQLISGDRAQAAEILRQATGLAGTTRERQLVAIAAAHLAGDHDLADFMAREHLVDYPDSAFAAWIAAAQRTTPATPIHPSGRNRS
jgi:hypothetical protein